MVLEYLKRRRQRGGQFITFNDGATKNNAKLTWHKCNSSDIIKQLVEAADSTDSTAQVSELFESDSSDCDSSLCSEADNETAYTPVKEPPTWLKLPMYADICGNHAMVNAERQWASKNLHPLQRSRELDDLARAHAQEMASVSTTYHADPNQLCSKVSRKRPNNRMGSNVAKGKELRDLHDEMKKKASNYANMMDNRYQAFGIGTARDANGDLYLCQIFRG